MISHVTNERLTCELWRDTLFEMKYADISSRTAGFPSEYWVRSWRIACLTSFHVGVAPPPAPPSRPSQHPRTPSPHTVPSHSLCTRFISAKLKSVAYPTSALRVWLSRFHKYNIFLYDIGILSFNQLKFITI